MKWLRRTPLDPVRWVVLDCETSGLDAARDRLLSAGAVCVRDGRVRLGETFHAFVRQPAPSSPENILIHGIGGDAQLAGRPLSGIIESLAAYVGGGVPVAFHAPFDAAVLGRHGLRLKEDWLDLATLLPAVFPGRGELQSALDHWLAEFAIPSHLRHDALGDAFATAQLLLIALTEAKRQRLETVEQLMKAGRDARWLARQ